MLDGGRIVEQGTHDELLALDGRYAAQLRAGASESIIIDPVMDSIATIRRSRAHDDRAIPTIDVDPWDGDQSPSLPLGDLRVLDLSTVIAGPTAPGTWPTSGPTSSRSNGPAGTACATWPGATIATARACGGS